MTGGSPLDGSRSTARMATLRSPTWILREPRIGPVVTLSSGLAGASAMRLSPSLRPCERDQVRRVRRCCAHLSHASVAPQGRIVLKLARCAALGVARLFPALCRLDLGRSDDPIVVGVEAVELGEVGGAGFLGANV